jgi:hypothetical protein
MFIMDYQIDRLQWQTFTDQFSVNNENRLVNLEVLSAELGDEFLAEGTSFTALDYDPKKHESLLISVHGSEGLLTHIISNPKELWVNRNEAGNDVALEIVSDADRTIVRFL